ncbi:hypothetical protein AAKU67_000207 [Oxalobacteraceae bacterium GrIS 2.11]
MLTTVPAASVSRPDRFSQLPDKLALHITEFMPPSALALTSVASKKWLSSANRTFASPCYIDSIPRHLGSKNAQLAHALKNRNPTIQEFFHSFNTIQKPLTQLLLNPEMGGFFSDQPTFRNSFIRSVSVAASIEAGKIQQTGSPNMKELFKSGQLQLDLINKIVSNILKNLSDECIGNWFEAGNLSLDDVSALNERGIKNLKNPAVFSLFSQGEITIQDVCDADESRLKEWNEAFFKVIKSLCFPKPR